jgi:two-component system cell cycle response regulator
MIEIILKSNSGRHRKLMHKAAPTCQVLVVDDSPVSRKLVEHALESSGHTLLFAKSGTEALEIFRREAPAIVVTDWMMPDFSGIELCQKIRADDQREYTYVIVLSAKSEKDSVVKGLAAGADDYLTKPFDAGELLARIGVGCRTVELHREIDAKNRLLEALAHTDSMTDLPNRRAIEDWAARQLRGAARHGFPMWVVQADLDSFKEINDSYGHDAGDVVLKRFSEILKGNTRASDICGRMGGDEFLLVITHVEKAYIEATINRLREEWAACEFDFGGKRVSITASFGIAGFCGREAPTFQALVQRADKALYEAKRNGGNHVKTEITTELK